MKRFTATLSAAMTITAESPRAVRRNAIDDAVEYAGENSHDVVKVVETPMAEPTRSIGRNQMDVEFDHDFEGAGGDEVEDEARVSFDVAFDAPDAETARIIAPSVPKHLIKAASVATGLRVIKVKGTIQGDVFGRTLTVRVGREEAAKVAAEFSRPDYDFAAVTVQQGADAGEVRISLPFDDTVACLMARTVMATDPLLANAARQGGVYVTTRGSRDGTFQCELTTGEATDATIAALGSIACAIARQSRASSNGSAMLVACIAPKSGPATLMAAAVPGEAREARERVLAVASIASEIGAEVDVEALTRQIPGIDLIGMAA